MGFVKVANVNEERFRNENPRKRRKCLLVGSRSVTLFLLDDKYFCMDSACHHMGGPLYKGDIEEIDGRHILTCQSHGYRVLVETGEMVGVGANGQYEVGERKQRVHPVQINSQGDIYVDVEFGNDQEIASDKFNTNLQPPPIRQQQQSQVPTISPSKKISQTQLNFRSRKRAAVAALKDPKHRRIEYEMPRSTMMAFGGVGDTVGKPRPLFLKSPTQRSPVMQPGHPVKKQGASPQFSLLAGKPMRQPLITFFAE